MKRIVSKEIDNNNNSFEKMISKIDSVEERNILRVINYCNQSFEYENEYFTINGKMFVPGIYCVDKDAYYVFDFIDRYKQQRELINQLVDKFKDELNFKWISLEQYERIINRFKDEISTLEAETEIEIEVKVEIVKKEAETVKEKETNTNNDKFKIKEKKVSIKNDKFKIKKKMVSKMTKIKSSDNTFTIKEIIESVSDEAERNLLKIMNYCKRQFEYQCHSFELDNTVFIPNIFCLKNTTFYILNFIDYYRSANKQKIINQFKERYPEVKIKQISLKQYRRIISWFQDDILFESEKYKINFSLYKRRRIKCVYCGKKFFSENKNDRYCSEECAKNAMNNKDECKIKKLRRYHNGYYMDIHHYVRSSWEHNIARILQVNQLDYDYEEHAFKLSNGGIYIPDFYVYADDTYYEVKGEIRTNTLAKYNMFREEYPDKRLVIIDNKIYKDLLDQFPSINFTKHIIIKQERNNNNQKQLKNVTQYRHDKIKYETWELDYKLYTNRRYCNKKSNKMITINQARVQLNMSSQQIYSAIQHSNLEFYLIGKKYYFDQQFIDNYTVEQSCNQFVKVCSLCHQKFITDSIEQKFCFPCKTRKHSLITRKSTRKAQQYYFFDIHHFVTNKYIHNIARVLQLCQIDYDYENFFLLKGINDWICIDFYIPLEDTYYVMYNTRNSRIKQIVELFRKEYPNKKLILLSIDVINDIVSYTSSFTYINFNNHVDVLDAKLHKQDPSLLKYLQKHLKTVNIEEKLVNVNKFRHDKVKYSLWELDYRLYTNQRKIKNKIHINNINLLYYKAEEIINYINQGSLIYQRINDDYYVNSAGIETLKNELNSNKVERTCQQCGKTFYTNYVNYSKFCSLLCMKRNENEKNRNKRMSNDEELVKLDKTEQRKLLHQRATNKNLEEKKLNIDSLSNADDFELIQSENDLLLAKFLKSKNIHFKYESEYFLLSTGQGFVPRFFLFIDNTYYFINPGKGFPYKDKIDQFSQDFPDKKIVILDLKIVNCLCKHVSLEKDQIVYNEDNYYTMREACSVLDVSRSMLNVCRNKGLLNFLKINKSTILYEKKSINAFLKNSSSILKPKKYKHVCALCKKEFLSRNSFTKFCSYKCSCSHESIVKRERRKHKRSI